MEQSISDRKGYDLKTASQQKGIAKIKNNVVSHTFDDAETIAVTNQFNLILNSLDDAKAEGVVPIDIRGKSSLGDYMIIASGRSQRHVGAVADQLLRALKDSGIKNPRIEGLSGCDWVLIDTGDVVIHLFRPEIREFYNLEKMWMTPEEAEALRVRSH